MSNSGESKGKVQRQNQIKRYLARTSEESAQSISEITERLQASGFRITRKSVERDIVEITCLYELKESGSNPTRFYFDGDFKLDFELVFDETQLQTIILALQSFKQMSPKIFKVTLDRSSGMFDLGIRSVILIKTLRA